MQDINTFVEQWHHTYRCPLILRIDSDGALFATHDGYRKRCTVCFTVVDTIGAGDTHAGGVLAGFWLGIAGASCWATPWRILCGEPCRWRLCPER